MTDHTPREVIATTEVVNSPYRSLVGRSSTYLIIAALDRAGFEIVPKGAVKAEREACAEATGAT